MPQIQFGVEVTGSEPSAYMNPRKSVSRRHAVAYLQNHVFERLKRRTSSSIHVGVSRMAFSSNM